MKSPLMPLCALEQIETPTSGMGENVSSNITRPVIKLYSSLSIDDAPIVKNTYTSPEDGTKRELVLSQKEYFSILEKILADRTLVCEIITNWLEYADLLSRSGDEATPPHRKYYDRFLKMCDDLDPSRAAIISMLLSERIEAEILAQVIAKDRPDWAERFSIVRSSGVTQNG